MKFEELLKITRRNEPNWVPPKVLLALDPGETTGWAVFSEGHLVEEGQADTKTEMCGGIYHLLEAVQPTQIICEDYRVYAHKTDSHAWNALHTPQLIGATKMWCFINEVNIAFQMAATAKPFCTPQKLKEWGFWKEGMRHADDAIKHGAYFLLFHDRKVVQQ